MFVITGATTTRDRLYEFAVGSDATPADAGVKFSWRRTSARGTQSATVTPTAIDSADPASVSTYDTAWNVNPTITASSDLYQWAQNQRATFRWIAAPDSELVIPATSGAGLALMSVVASATANYAFTASWQE